MKRFWRSCTAILLASVFLFLSFAAEFSHNHVSAESLLALHSDTCDYANEDNPAIQTRASICLACIHSATSTGLSLYIEQYEPILAQTGLVGLSEIVFESGFSNFISRRAPPLSSS